jgi:sugar phosphate isomerase/epimerase
MNRRQLLSGLSTCGIASTFALVARGQAVANARIRQSVVFWCFNTFGDHWDLERTCRVARDLGCSSVELVPADQWHVLRKFNLTCALARNGMPSGQVMRGFNNPRYHEEVIDHTRKAIDACAEANVHSVIAFVGSKLRNVDDPQSGDISLADGADHCVRGLRPVIEQAVKRRVTVCIEHLNTRDSAAMKGYPGYQGDNLDWLAGIIRRVNSPRLKLLFDIYHVQVMHGDLLRRLDQCRDIIGHVHTAGAPGRGELDDRQEIQYPAVMRRLLEIKYTGYVGQEFMPTRNAEEGLRQAVRLCDV